MTKAPDSREGEKKAKICSQIAQKILQSLILFKQKGETELFGGKGLIYGEKCTIMYPQLREIPHMSTACHCCRATGNEFDFF